MDNNRPKIKILVACHKADPNIRQDDIYMPIQVGAALHPELDLGFQKDNEGENISEKNPSYCELTALYWAWKNLPKDIEYVGLVHYRRYFDLNSQINTNRDCLIVDNIYKVNFSNQSARIINLMKKYDIILSKPTIYPLSVEDEYRRCHIDEDIQFTKMIIREHFPEFYNICKKVLSNNKLIHYNMFITRREIFDEYCEWLFTILKLLESKIKLSEYDVQKRVYGYIGERLLNIYLEHYKNKLKIKYLPIFKICNDEKENLIKYNLRIFRNELIFLLLGKNTIGE